MTEEINDYFITFGFCVTLVCLEATHDICMWCPTCLPCALYDVVHRHFCFLHACTESFCKLPLSLFFFPLVFSVWLVMVINLPLISESLL